MEGVFFHNKKCARHLTIRKHGGSEFKSCALPPTLQLQVQHPGATDKEYWLVGARFNVGYVVCALSSGRATERNSRPREKGQGLRRLPRARSPRDFLKVLFATQLGPRPLVWGACCIVHLRCAASVRPSVRPSARPFSDRAIERASDRAIERAIDRASDRATERSKQASDRAIDRASDRASDRAIERSSERSSHRSIEPSSDRPHTCPCKLSVDM